MPATDREYLGLVNRPSECQAIEENLSRLSVQKKNRRDAAGFPFLFHHR